MLIDGDDPVRGRLAAVGVLLVSALVLPSHASTGEQQAKIAALKFGSALTRGDASALKAVLPAQGRVGLRLVRFGPEEGSYSAEQVEALFKDFLRQGEVRSFDLLRLQCATDQFTLVHARAGVNDREGRPREIDLHLTFRPEGDRWVLRESRETSP